MTGTQQVWLTQEAYERLKQELAVLLAQRSGQGASTGSGLVEDRDPDTFDDQSFTEQRDREQRIRKLQETLQYAVVGEEPPDDGIAEPGMVLTVRFADEPDTETFLLADPEQHDTRGDIESCSPSSPLGMALSGAKQGEQRQYRLPDGRVMTVSMVRAVPYGHHVQQA
ncbi:MAG: transcription elongation factor GreAB [Pseudonocardiaceae bacterium]|nr:transcription elongation factor GreAB [Pseudonocardiaceae bacterium]